MKRARGTISRRAEAQRERAFARGIQPDQGADLLDEQPDYGFMRCGPKPPRRRRVKRDRTKRRTPS